MSDDYFYMVGEDPADYNMATVTSTPFFHNETGAERLEKILGFPVVMSEKVPGDEIRLVNTAYPEYVALKLK
jgi:hypothetical protein